MAVTLTGSPTTLYAMFGVSIILVGTLIRRSGRVRKRSFEKR
jgi:hypothetical protein